MDKEKLFALVDKADADLKSHSASWQDETGAKLLDVDEIRLHLAKVAEYVENAGFSVSEACGSIPIDDLNEAVARIAFALENEYSLQGSAYDEN